ncbi:hypothetical protein M3Y97_00212900 [Aphelenchoides bicaudatus]|nr:hypothetical protein M3Y97_00212900 [Aphelenchoides bicaudatus]
MAGPFSSLAEKRAHEMAANRATSLDITSKTAPNSVNHTPTHHSSDAISTAVSVNLVNTGRTTNKPESPTNYFRPAHSLINFGKLSFLITHQPTVNSLETYISDLDRKKVNNLVRVCAPNYSAEPLQEHGIKVYDWEFEDGKWPTNDIIQKFLSLCLDVFSNSSNESIAIHCVAGLGRSPVLVAIALLESGMKFDDAVFLIRSNRRGALNDKQLEFLRQYKPTGRLRKLRYSEGTKQRKSCAIM